jgi:hypothetical protein
MRPPICRNMLGSAIAYAFTSLAHFQFGLRNDVGACRVMTKELRFLATRRDSEAGRRHSGRGNLVGHDRRRVSTGANVSVVLVSARQVQQNAVLEKVLGGGRKVEAGILNHPLPQLHLGEILYHESVDSAMDYHAGFDDVCLRRGQARGGSVVEQAVPIGGGVQ